MFECEVTDNTKQMKQKVVKMLSPPFQNLKSNRISIFLENDNIPM